MRNYYLLEVAVFLVIAGRLSAVPQLVIAEGESFIPQKDHPGWQLTVQDQSFASHTYGGMWSSHGAMLGAPPESVGAVAVKTVTIPVPGVYRVWSKYQAPPYFNYVHRIKILQRGKVVFNQVYGKLNAPRFWSFAGAYKTKPFAQCWWSWGVDHDAAEAPKTTAQLQVGPAEIQLITEKNPAPAADRFIDFIVLTTQLADTYDGWQPYRTGSPFCLEASKNTPLYMRFRNTSAQPARLIIIKPIGHFQPWYRGWTKKFPASDKVDAGKWSSWIHLGRECRLVHDEGLIMTVPEAKEIPLEFALSADGRQPLAARTIQNGDSLVIPLDFTWNRKAKLKTSREYAAEITAACRHRWRTVNYGKKPRKIAWFGRVFGENEMKDAIGYNTLLPDSYDKLKKDGYFCHARTLKMIRTLGKRLAPEARKNFHIISFGDEIGLGRGHFKKPETVEKFRDWLRKEGISAAQLGTSPDHATPSLSGENTRLIWYSSLFQHQQSYAHFIAMTKLAEQLFHPGIFTGANFSPHHLALYYGPIYQWVDLFKHRGMSAFWAEDYIFSVPEAPQIISWQFAQMRCAVKYHQLPIHFYVMPHAPGQVPAFLRRNLLFSIGAGAQDIDTYCVAPEERFTENYVAWTHPETFRTLHEAIYDSAEVEDITVPGRFRAAKVALITGKATDFNESRLFVPREQDPFGRRCANAPKKMNQILCRKEQQMLYLALRHAQYGVDLITEDDVSDGILKQYKAVYFAGEWINKKVIPPLRNWVKKGGIFYACGGLGHRNQFNLPEPEMLALLGLKSETTRKNAVVIRTLLELPLLPPIDQLWFKGRTVNAIGLRQQLQPRPGVRVLAQWKNGTAAATVRQLGKGKIFAVGTLPGFTWMKTGVRPIPWARGGYKNLYNPSGFSAATTALVTVGVEAAGILRQAVCSNSNVEILLMDSKKGTVVTLINWDNAPVNALQVRIRLARKPKAAWHVRRQRSVPFSFADGIVTLSTSVDDADFIILRQ